jgi:hypothetical protein
MRTGTPTATFTLRDFVGTSTVEVVGENRTITATNGVFQDAFANWGVHIYKVITPASNGLVQTSDEKSFKIYVKKIGSESTLNYQSNDVVSKIEVYDIFGKQLFSKAQNSSTNTILLNCIMPQIIIVKAYSGSKYFIQKHINK